MSHREETPGQTQNSLEGLCIRSGLGTPWDRPGSAGEWEVWDLLPPRPDHRYAVEDGVNEINVKLL